MVAFTVNRLNTGPSLDFGAICVLSLILKEQCVGFRGIYWQKWNIIFIIMFSLVYNHMYHMYNLYLHREQVLFIDVL